MAETNPLISSVLFVFLLSSAGGRCFADASVQTVIAVGPDPAGLVAHYEFEGDAVDTSGFQPAADGLIVGNPTYGPGVFGWAVGLDSDGDYVDCGNGSYFDITEQITVTAWIKVNEFDKKFQTIISKGDNSWRLARVSDSNNVEFACNGTAATKWTGVGEIPWAVSGRRNVNDGKWHHIGGVFDGTRLYLYIDGALEAAKAAAKSIDISKYNVCIGANAQVPGREWNGFIDDVRGWDFVSVNVSEVYSGEDPGPPDNDPMDFQCHGTHVSGIVGAVEVAGKALVFVLGVMFGIMTFLIVIDIIIYDFTHVLTGKENSYEINLLVEFL